MTMHKRDFILAMSMFVAMAVIGTVFALWQASQYGPQRAPQTLDARR